MQKGGAAESRGVVATTTKFKVFELFACKKKAATATLPLAGVPQGANLEQCRSKAFGCCQKLAAIELLRSKGNGSTN